MGKTHTDARGDIDLTPFRQTTLEEFQRIERTPKLVVHPYTPRREIPDAFRYRICYGP